MLAENLIPGDRVWYIDGDVVYPRIASGTVSAVLDVCEEGRVLINGKSVYSWMVDIDREPLLDTLLIIITARASEMKQLQATILQEIEKNKAKKGE